MAVTGLYVAFVIDNMFCETGLWFSCQRIKSIYVLTKSSSFAPSRVSVNYTGCPPKKQNA